MAKFCMNCGHEIPEGMTFCTECGARVADQSQAGTAAAAPGASAGSTYRPAPPAAPVYASAPEEAETKVVSTIGFWALHLLYKLPIVGFICSLVLSLAPRNRNLRHHALANFIWKLIGIALFITLLLLARPAFKKMQEAFNEAFQSFSQSQAASGMDMNDLMQQFMNGDIDGFLEQYGGGGSFAYPDGGEESLEDVLRRFGADNMGELLQKYQNGEITEADLENLG